MKVVFLGDGGLQDAGWNLLLWNGLQEAVDLYDIELFVNADLGFPEIQPALEDYSEAGADLIIAHGAAFTDPVSAIAPNFPETKYWVSTGWMSTNPNMISFWIKEHEPSYLAGALAGLMTETDTVGYISGIDYPNVLIKMNAYKAGAKSVNPDAKVIDTYVGSWRDPARGKELTLSMVASGADIIYTNSSGSDWGVLDAVKETNTRVIWQVSDVHELAPELWLSSVIYDFAKMGKTAVKMVLDGTWEGQLWRPGLESEYTYLGAFYGNVPPNVEDQVRQLKDDIVAGNITVPEIEEHTPP